ncbi:hypothetical protein HDK90DRAFT_335000 [Phyllosticta capitalensis]|uniref:Retrotransposon gag domain-containing protein n=1 Tax=Phyllosticta capitalensis TaxID=121624 RepID=A0ABR1YKK5_9PEZI
MDIYPVNFSPDFMGGSDDSFLGETTPEPGYQYGQTDYSSSVPHLNRPWMNRWGNPYSQAVDFYAVPQPGLNWQIPYNGNDAFQDTVHWNQMAVPYNQFNPKQLIGDSRIREGQFKEESERPKRRDSETSQDIVERLVALENDSRNRFDKWAVGMFSPDENSGADASRRGTYSSDQDKRYYHDVEYFIDAALAAHPHIRYDVLRRSLHMCLLDAAQAWYTSVLTDREREYVTEGEQLDNWMTLLRRRWGPSDEQVFEDLSTIRFPGTAGHCNFTKFAMENRHLCGRVGIVKPYEQLKMAWLRIDRRLRARVARPREDELHEEFVKRVVAIKLN